MQVAVLGFGTVGRSVYEMLADAPGLAPGPVLVRRGKEDAPFKLSDMAQLLVRPDVDAVAEALTGVEPAYTYVKAALNAGKHVVTANKALVAAHGPELAALAGEKGVGFLFSASCGGGVPFLQNLALAARSDRVTAVGGILNGTTNFMLDAMQRRQLDYTQALAEAQRLGYAEADPTADVSGLDSLRKIMLACAVAYGVLPEKGMHWEGIMDFTAADAAHIRHLGLCCRLLASGGQTASGRLHAYVEPVLLPQSAPECAVSTGRVVLLPVEPSVMSYQKVFENAKVWIGYKNTLIYTVLGTLINVFMTLICAYPLARKTLPNKGFFTFLFTFTMLFSGGMIPSYLVMRDLHILNSIWVMILPGAIGISQMIVTRTFIRSTIPDELLEAAQIDGCNDFRFFAQFVLPLSKAVIAVIAMQYAIGHWNSYFSAFIYLSDSKKYPLQISLREILVMNQIDTSDIADPELAIAMQGMADLLKYALIVVATAPILCVYPFIQKYFVKGVMMGSLKG